MDSKYRVSRSKTRLGLGLSLVILEGTKLGLGLGIVEVSCKVSDSESRLENSDPGNSEPNLTYVLVPKLTNVKKIIEPDLLMKATKKR